MRYVMIGAGAVGGTIGARLFQGGHDVLLVARGAHHDALRTKGLRLVTPAEDTVLDIPVTDGPVPAGGDDVLIVATKSQHTLDALAGWPRELPVICAQNGVSNENAVREAGFEHVYGMCVWLPAQNMEPGVVGANGHPHSGMLHVGLYPQGVDKLSEKVAEDLRDSGFVARATPDVMRWKYGKLLSNLGNAAEAVASGDILPIVTRARDEARAILDAAGIAYSTAEEEQELRGHLVDFVPIDGIERGGGSSWQSLAKGAGSIESDYLNGEIVRVGGGVAPVNEVLRREANRFAEQGLPPSSMPAETLQALIDERSAAVSR
ncbi:hypothetical protein OIE66_38970 [Nonomuraea sp. NBC_01738]|uniref:ketopantoate reductase family protein n=1 Tax=Nonomuraea sp. NBC_01738 TaxID=2976003 RepID=UPI002E0FE350|nr:hypothetical protein OIE66_38970 [Nonomuraea sp. NBC_01738]